MLRSQSYIATPPGATIKEQLEDRGMNQKEFAARMDMSEKHVSNLINGEVKITPDTAYKLEIVLGVPAEFWNNLEAVYRSKIAKAKAENAMDADMEIARKFPYSEMAKYDWVPVTKEPKEKVLNLRKYFEVVQLSLLDNEQITKIACRRLATTEKSNLALIAWAQRVKIQSRNISVEPINLDRLVDFIPKFKHMTLLDPKDFVPQLKMDFARCGIALVFVPHLKGSFLHGASFVDGNKIVIGITARGKDADRFWFSLFHEIAHILLGHIGQFGGISEEDEKRADRYARDMLIEQDAFLAFKEKKDYSRQSVLMFAKEQGIAPGIVVGRMQTERMLLYNELNDLKEKYKIVS